MKRFMQYVVIAALMFVTTGFASELDGAWKGKIEGPDGAMELVFTFKVDGNTMTGTVSGPMGEGPISNGKVAGSTFSFDTDGGGMTISHTGTIAGDKLTISAVQFAMEFTCERVGNTGAADINGRWGGAMSGPDGSGTEIFFTFKVENGSLSGTVESPMGEIPLTNTKISGSEFSFDADAGGMVISHKCKLVNDTIVMKYSGFGDESELILKRSAK